MKIKKSHYPQSLILIFLLLPLANRSFAQENTNQAGSVLTGRITDSLTKEHITFATVSLFSDSASNALTIGISDEEGFFKIEKIPSGRYKISVKVIGYRVKVISSIKLDGDSLLHLGSIPMKRSDQLLQAVEVHGQIPLIQNKVDRLVYHAEGDPTISGGNAADVLRKAPMLSVDLEGNVSLRGDRQVRILIDGKPSGAMNNNVADALRMIPADQIKSIEVITSPSSKFDGEGSAGMINILTKRNAIAGMNGSVAGGFGTRQNNFNGNINMRKGKLGFTGNLGKSWSWPIKTLITFDQSLLNGEPVLSQENASENTRKGIRGSVAFEYHVDTNAVIISNFSLNQLSIHTDNDLDNVYNGIHHISSTNKNRQRFGGFDWSADYIQKLSKKGQEISVSVQFMKNNTHTDYSSLYEQTGFRPNETGYNSGINNELTFQMDYTHPVKKAVLELGAKAILRDILSEVKVDTLINADAYINVKRRTYDFEYKQQVGAGYATLSISFSEKMEAKGGLRYEYTVLDGDAIKEHPAFRNQYHNVLPSIVLSYKATGKSTFKGSYNQRIQRPSLYFLNPFRNEADPINQLQGNPDLSPERSHTIELGNHRIFKNTMLNVSFYNRKTTNVIEPVYTNVMEEGKSVVLQSFANIGNIQSFGTSLYASINLMNTLTLRGNVDVYTYRIKPREVFREYTDQGNKTFIHYKTFLSATIDLKKGIVAESFLFFDALERTFQGHYAAFNMWSMGVKKEIFKKQGTIGLTFVDPFNDVKNLGSYAKTSVYEQRGNFALPFRSFGINFSWRFGKNNSSQEGRSPNILNDDQKAGGQTG